MTNNDKHHGNYIGGQWVTPASGKYSPDINPGNTDEIVGYFALSSETDALNAVKAAHESFAEWSATPGPERGKILYRFADLLEEHQDDLARSLTEEEGKILNESIGEVHRAAMETRFMAGEASRLTGEHFGSEKVGVEIFRRLEPVGPIAVITPWNFPIVTPIRKISPALAYGDTIILKPATLTPWSAVKLVELYEQAGVPKGVINLVTGQGSLLGDVLCSAKEIKGITFTGSTEIGRHINRMSADTFARVQLEMGGKNPALVFDAEDLEVAADQIVNAAFASGGQRCTAVSRVIVSQKEHDELVEALGRRISALKVGDPLAPETDIGPLSSENQVQTVEKYLSIARSEGAEIVVGGGAAEGPMPGYYYQPTLVTAVSRSSPLALEEIFGPILSVLKADSFEEGLEICNDPVYGLAGCVFTRELRRAKQFIRNMKSGMVHINHGTASEAHVPFGGVKNSGYGAYSIGSTAKDFYMCDKVVYVK